jgi:hypothetical protein
MWPDVNESSPLSQFLLMLPTRPVTPLPKSAQMATNLPNSPYFSATVDDLNDFF